MSAQPAAMMCEQQRKSIYGYARELGMSTRSADGDDELHVLVAGITGKDSLKLLKYAEAEKVLAELKHRGRFGGAARPPAQTSRKRTDEGGRADNVSLRRKIYMLAQELGWSENQVNTFCYNQYGISRQEWMPPQLLSKVINAFDAMVDREKKTAAL